MRKGSTTNVTDTTLVLVPRVANGGKQWYTKNLKVTLEKRSQQWNLFSNSESERKDPL